MRLCPRHGPVEAYGRRCPRADCGLPLLRLDGSAEWPQVWKWESCASRPEVRAGPLARADGAAGERYRGEIAALAREGYGDDEIVAWFKPLGVALTAADVEAALCESYLR